MLKPLLVLIGMLVLEKTSYADEKGESIFLTYTPLSRAAIYYPTFDFGIGYVTRYSEEFSLRLEYEFVRSESETLTRFVDRGPNSYSEKSRVRYDLHSLSIGGQHQLGNFVIWGALLLSYAGGSIDQLRQGRENDAHPFSTRYVSTQMGSGYRWDVGEQYVLGLDFVVFPIYLWRKTVIERPEEATYFNYSPWHEVSAPVNAAQDLKMLRLVLGIRF